MVKVVRTAWEWEEKLPPTPLQAVRQGPTAAGGVRFHCQQQRNNAAEGPVSHLCLLVQLSFAVNDFPLTYINFQQHRLGQNFVLFLIVAFVFQPTHLFVLYAREYASWCRCKFSPRRMLSVPSTLASEPLRKQSMFLLMKCLLINGLHFISRNIPSFLHGFDARALGMQSSLRAENVHRRQQAHSHAQCAI